MKKSLCISAISIALLFLLIVAGPVAAKGGANHLDLSFGRNGRALVRPGIDPIRYWSDWSAFSAASPGGRTVVLTGNSNGQALIVYRFEKDGKLDPDFGQGGVSAWEPGFAVYPAGVAVDGDGDIVLISSRPKVSQSAEPSKRTVVTRLSSNGSLDLGFGSAGFVEPDLQVPASEWEATHEPPGSEPTAVAIDSAGRILVSGTAIRAVSICTQNSAYLARLLPEGALDPSFGSGGRVIYDTETLAIGEGLMLGPDRSITAWGLPPICKPPNPAVWRITRTTEVGSPQAGFGSGGILSSGATEGASVDALTVDGRGRTLFVTGDNLIHRLLPSGSPDPSFGKGRGVVMFDPTLPGGGESTESKIGGIATAPDGSVLVSGTAIRGPSLGESPPTTSRRLFLGSLIANGKPRRGFGRHGVVILSSPKGAGTVGRSVRALGNHAALVTGTTGGGSAVPGVGLFRFLIPSKGSKATAQSHRAPKSNGLMWAADGAAVRMPSG